MKVMNNKQQTISSNEEFISLFDYLGKAAGSELGKQVYNFAKYAKAQIRTRQISNPKFTGEIMLYKREVLNTFFQLKKIYEN